MHEYELCANHRERKLQVNRRELSKFREFSMFTWQNHSGKLPSIGHLHLLSSNHNGGDAMNWDAIGAIGELLGSTAVLVTLIAILFQMRQSAKMERAAAQRDVLDRVTQFTKGLNETDRNDSFLLTLHDYNAAPTGARLSAESHLFEFAFVTESALNMHRDGFFSDGTWAGIEGVMLGMLRTPGGAVWWQHARLMLGFEIALHLDRRLTEIDPATPTYLEISRGSRDRLAELLNKAS
jgi:hypothetical protein